MFCLNFVSGQVQLKERRLIHRHQKAILDKLFMSCVTENNSAPIEDIITKFRDLKTIQVSTVQFEVVVCSSCDSLL